ncbi:hypothetical protein KUTeg_022104 [Tegillarca granosa]|uniref:Uncharacterized protein n=1 Tax=Tegillarca granosa TaxID=220873 RepID=A0ABQ9EAT9_TEGGR|nr:hypothetical protein KUTeg_022104 [Tegillarca granosa]
MKLNADNILRANFTNAKILKDYIKKKNQDDSFEQNDEIKLKDIISHFYMDLRKPDGKTYKSLSLKAVRNVLNRYLKYPPYNKVLIMLKIHCLLREH